MSLLEDHGVEVFVCIGISIFYLAYAEIVCVPSDFFSPLSTVVLILGFLTGWWSYLRLLSEVKEGRWPTSWLCGLLVFVLAGQFLFFFGFSVVQEDAAMFFWLRSAGETKHISVCNVSSSSDPYKFESTGGGLDEHWGKVTLNRCIDPRHKDKNTPWKPCTWSIRPVYEKDCKTETCTRPCTWALSRDSSTAPAAPSCSGGSGLCGFEANRFLKDGSRSSFDQVVSAWAGQEGVDFEPMLPLIALADPAETERMALIPALLSFVFFSMLCPIPSCMHLLFDRCCAREHPEGRRSESSEMRRGSDLGLRISEVSESSERIVYQQQQHGMQMTQMQQPQMQAM